MPLNQPKLFLAVRLVLAAGLLGAAAACAVPAGPDQPASVAPSTLTPAAPTAPPPTATAVPPATVPPDAAALETILILEPGLGASIASPVRVAGESEPTFEQSLVVEIFGADGRSLAIVPAQIEADLGQRGPYAAEVAFDVDADQPGRVSVYALSAQDGGLIHLTSVEVTLLAAGASSPAPAQPLPEAIDIVTPEFLATVTGGVARLTGFAAPAFENRLVVVICGEGGGGAPDRLCGTVDNTLGAGEAMVASPAVGQPGPFAAEIAYAVAEPVRGRIVVYSASPRDGGLTHVSSRAVILQP